MIQIYGMPKSRTTRVLWALEEVNADYEFIKLNLNKGETQQKHYLKLNPSGKLPTLVHNELVLTESAAICTYISDLFPQSNLIPAYKSLDRATYNQWCYFAMTELEQPLWSLAKHKFVLPQAYRIKDMSITANYEFEKALDTLSLGLNKLEFLVGNKFTCADIIVANILSWTKQNGKTIIPLKHNNIKQYLQRMLSRKAFYRVQKREQN